MSFPATPTAGASRRRTGGGAGGLDRGRVGGAGAALDILADVEAATDAPAPLPHFPFLDGDIAAVAAYTLDRLEDKHTLPSGPWSP